jgi:starch synthase
MHSGLKSGLFPLDHKVQSKTALQEQLGWPSEPKRPMVCLPFGMTDALGGALLQDVLPGILSLPVELLVLGKGSSTFGSLFTKLSKEQSHRVHIIADKEQAINAMLAASDMALFLSKDPSAKELSLCLQYGIVPISLPHQLLEDYNPIQETGNAFLYENETKWNCFAQLVRAVETHKFPFDWKTIQRHCQEKVR